MTILFGSILQTNKDPFAEPAPHLNLVMRVRKGWFKSGNTLTYRLTLSQLKRLSCPCGCTYSTMDMLDDDPESIIFDDIGKLQDGDVVEVRYVGGGYHNHFGEWEDDYELHASRTTEAEAKQAVLEYHEHNRLHGLYLVRQRE